MTDKNKLIDRKKYPELDFLLWDTQSRYITKERAFETYERLFHHIQKELLTDLEKELIQELTNEIGKGYMLTR